MKTLSDLTNSEKIEFYDKNGQVFIAYHKGDGEFEVKETELCGEFDFDSCEATLNHDGNKYPFYQIFLDVESAQQLCENLKRSDIERKERKIMKSLSFYKDELIQMRNDLKAFADTEQMKNDELLSSIYKILEKYN